MPVPAASVSSSHPLGSHWDVKERKKEARKQESKKARKQKGRRYRWGLEAIKARSKSRFTAWLCCSEIHPQNAQQYSWWAPQGSQENALSLSQNCSAAFGTKSLDSSELWFPYFSACFRKGFLEDYIWDNWCEILQHPVSNHTCGPSGTYLVLIWMHAEKLFIVLCWHAWDRKSVV